MSQQAHQSGGAAPAITPLRTPRDFGDEGIRQIMQMDLTLLSPLPVDRGWYERYWYGDASPSRWGNLIDTACRLCREVSRVGSGWHAIWRSELAHSLLDSHRSRYPSPSDAD